jgi:hypothetical protein
MFSELGWPTHNVAFVCSYGWTYATDEYKMRNLRFHLHIHSYEAPKIDEHVYNFELWRIPRKKPFRKEALDWWRDQTHDFFMKDVNNLYLISKDVAVLHSFGWLHWGERGLVIRAPLVPNQIDVHGPGGLNINTTTRDWEEIYDDHESVFHPFEMEKKRGFILEPD